MAIESIDTAQQLLRVFSTREEEILTEATSTFAKSGFRSTDVQLIADSLGIGKGTIYRAFPTKQLLFLACVDRAMRRLFTRMQNASPQSAHPLERVKAAIKAYLAFFDENPELLELIIQERSEFKDRSMTTYFDYRNRAIQPLNDQLAALIVQGEVRPVKPEEITDFISQQLYGKLFTHYFTGSKDSLAKDADYLIDLLFHGFLTRRQADRNQT